MIDKMVQARREMVEKSIALNPANITLKRPTTAEGQSRGGGFDVTPRDEELPTQTFRLHLHGRIRQVVQHSSEAGTIKEVDHWLLARYDADILPDDYFVYDGREFVVEAIRRHYLKGKRVSLNVELRERGKSTV